MCFRSCFRTLTVILFSTFFHSFFFKDRSTAKTKDVRFLKVMIKQRANVWQNFQKNSGKDSYSSSKLFNKRELLYPLCGSGLDMQQSIKRV